jgi:uroporphyrinogen decarboxylase
MTKAERVRAALRGEPVDRIPMSFWGHDWMREWSAEGLAEAMLERHVKFDWDWMKLNPRACYHSQAWGGVYRPSGSPYEPPTLVDHPVKTVADLDRVEVLDADHGALGEQLQAISLIRQRIDSPFVQTVFSPMAVLGLLVGIDSSRPTAEHPPLLLKYLKTDPARAHRALQAITDTLAKYAAECLRRGANGIFFAPLKWSSLTLVDEATYREFGRPYDLQFLAAVRGAEINILHICDRNIMFDLLAGYPVHAVNWDIHMPGNPTLAEALKRTGKTVMGGVNLDTTLGDRPSAVAEEIRAAVAATGGRRIMLSAGCAISPKVPDANLWAAKKALD